MSAELSFPKRSHWAWFLILYACFVIHGSYVPWQFQPRALHEALSEFAQVRWIPVTVGNRADMVANFLLYIPLAFFTMGALAMGVSPCRHAVSAITVVVMTSGLSVAIEFGQLWFPNRTVSLNDIIAQSMGGTVGTALWLVGGERSARVLRSLVGERRPAIWLERALAVYVLGLIGYSLLPLDVTINPAELYRKLLEGRVTLIPFSYTYESRFAAAYNLLRDVAVFVPVGAFFVVGFMQASVTRRSTSQASLYTALLAMLVESAQFFVYSRVVDITDILLAVVGGALGAAATNRWLAGTDTDSSAAVDRARWRRATLWVAVTATYVACLAAGYWYPYELTTDRTVIEHRLRGFVIHVPFAAMYSGTEFNAISQLLLRVLSYSVLGLTLWMAVHEIAWNALTKKLLFAIAVFIGVFLATAIETVQIAMPSHSTNLTELALCWIGVGLGVWIANRFRGMSGGFAKKR